MYEWSFGSAFLEMMGLIINLFELKKRKSIYLEHEWSFGSAFLEITRLIRNLFELKKRKSIYLNMNGLSAVLFWR